MHSVSASIEYVCSTTTAANSGPTTSLCTAGNATRPIAAIEGASAMTAVRTTSVAPGLVIVGAELRTLNHLNSITIRIAYKAQPRPTLADRVGRPLRLDPLAGQLRKRAVEIFDADGDVAVAGAEVVTSAIVVVGQLEHVVGAG